LSSPANQTYGGVDYLLGLLILLLAGMLVYWTGLFLQPVRLPPASPGSYHFLANIDDIAPGSALAIELEGKPWLLTNRDEHISAVSGHCTYRGSRIRWSNRNQVFICEGYGSTFDHRGNTIHGLASAPLEKLKIRTISNRIYGAKDLQ